MATVQDANVSQRNFNGIMNDKQADQNMYYRFYRFGLTVNVSQMLGGMNGYTN
jgi:hypothetical protein